MEVVSQQFKLGWPLGFQIVLFGQVLNVLGHIPEGSVAKNSKCYKNVMENCNVIRCSYVYLDFCMYTSGTLLSGINTAAFI